jgi:hypothetical protein
MTAPSWLADALAAAMIVIALYCSGRLVASRRWRRTTEVDADGIHVVMGVAMAGMLVPQLSPLPARVWEVVFGVAAARSCQCPLAGSARGHTPEPPGFLAAAQHGVRCRAGCRGPGRRGVRHGRFSFPATSHVPPYVVRPGGERRRWPGAAIAAGCNACVCGLGAIFLARMLTGKG